MRRKLTKYVQCAAIAACAASALVLPAFSQTFPVKPVRLISGFAAGGGNDIMARLLAQRLTEIWGQQVIVENRTGANTIIAMQFLARSQPDGYTLFLSSTALAINASLYTKLPFDTLGDFTQIGLAARAPLVIVTNPSLPAQSVRDLINLAKKHRGEMSFASAGAGSSNQLVAEMFKAAAGIEMVHVPYKGMGPALIDVVSGQVPVSFAGILPALPHIHSGKLRSIAVTTSQRSPALAGIPTVAESGLPGFEATEWFGITGPAKMPKEIVGRINADLSRILKIPELQERIVKGGATAAGDMTPEQFSAYVEAEIAKWGKAVRQSGARADL